MMDILFVKNQAVELVKLRMNQGCVIRSQDQYPIELSLNLTDSGPEGLGLLFQKTLAQFLFTAMPWSVSSLLSRKHAHPLFIKAMENNRLLLLERFSLSFFSVVSCKLLQL